MRNAISIDMMPSQSAWYSFIYPLSVCVCVGLNEMTFALPDMGAMIDPAEFRKFDKFGKQLKTHSVHQLLAFSE